MDALRQLPFWLGLAAGGAFPWPTLLVNVIGCFAIGVLAAAIGGFNKGAAMNLYCCSP